MQAGPLIIQFIIMPPMLWFVNEKYRKWRLKERMVQKIHRVPYFHG